MALLTCLAGVPAASEGPFILLSTGIDFQLPLTKALDLM